jgi:predicted aldo/keto reductase-like oxidoreductase
MRDGNGSHVSRRDFLQTAAGTAAMLGVWPEHLLAQGAPTTQPAALAKGVFGKTGYPATRISFGAILIGGPQATQLVQRAIDAGINLLHTDIGYTRGKSCEGIGALFGEKPEYRKKVFLCLKNSRPGDEESLDRVLKVLNTDYADLLVPTLQDPNAELLEQIVAFNDAMAKKGKIRFKGFTCHQKMNEVIELVLAKAPDAFDGTLLSLKPVGAPGGEGAAKADEQRERFEKSLKALRQQKVGIMSMKTGAQQAVRQGKAVFQAHAKHVLQAGADTVLTSISSFEQIEMITQLELSDLAMGPVERMLAAGLASGPCLMCGQCGLDCPRNVPVSDLVRVAAYPREPVWAEHAADEFARLHLNAEQVAAGCAGCTVCSKACPVGLASAETVRSIVERFGRAVA